MKKFIKAISIIIIILIVLFLTYFIYHQVSRLESESFISQDFLYVVQTHNAFMLFETLNESEILDTIFNNRDMKETYKMLVDVKSKLTGSKKKFLQIINIPASFVIYKNSRLALIFNAEMKSPVVKASILAAKGLLANNINFKISEETYKGILLYKLSWISKRVNFYFTHVKNILILSRHRSVIIKSITAFQKKKNLAEDVNYMQVRAQLGRSKLLTVYFNLDDILKGIKRANEKLYSNLKTLSILSIAGATMEVNENAVKINSFYSTDIKDKEILNLFLSAPGTVKGLHRLPLKTSSFATLKFDDFSTVWDYINAILLKTGQKEKQKELASMRKSIERLLNISLDDLLFSCLDDEITLSYIRGFKDPLIFISIKNKKKIKKALESFEKKNILTKFNTTIYKDIDINQIQLTSFFKFLSNIFAPDISLPYYIIYEDYFIICNAKEALQSYISSMAKDKTLMQQKYLKLLYSHIKKGNLIAYWDTTKSSFKILKQDNLFTRLIKKFRFGMLSMEFVDQGIKNKIIIVDSSAGGVKLVDGWPVKFNSPVWSCPTVYNIDNKNMDEIIVATEEGKIYLYDFYGELAVNWPVKASAEIITSPFAFYSPAQRGVIIGAGATSGDINLFTIDAFAVDNSPLTAGDGIEKNLIIKDLNNDSSPDFIYSSKQGRIHALKLDGRSLPGFPVQLEEEKKSSIALIDIGRDGNYEILCLPWTASGNIYFINNTGAVWNKKLSTGSKNFSTPVITKAVDGTYRIWVLTENGNLFQWDENGDLANNFPVPLNDKFLNPPVIGDFDADHKKEIICLSASGKIYMISKAGEIISLTEIPFKPIEGEKLMLTDINRDGKKELVVPCIDSIIRFFNKDMSIQLKVKGTTTPCIKDMDRDGKYEILTTSDDGHVYLYSMQ